MTLPDLTMLRALFAGMALSTLSILSAGAADQAKLAEAAHGIAMHGEPALPEGFTHFPYVNPEAPGGGSLRMHVVGTFDSLNPFIVRGVPARDIRTYVYESLMARSMDEPFTLYGLLAETVSVPDDRTSATFTLRPEARFSDGKPVTVDDVIFSLEVLRDHGRPNTRIYYRKVERIERPGPRQVRFVFAEPIDREMPLIIGLMPILPSHAMSADDFERTSLVPPVGSGPYVVDSVRAAAQIVYRRNEDYWGRDLAVNRGRFNFDEIRYIYFRDVTTAFEAFTKGLTDVYVEHDSARWAQAYDIPPVNDGRIQREELEYGSPKPMTGLVFNTRRPIFADIRVREALLHAFDFEWVNRNLFFGLYDRTQSYFAKSELSAHERPASAREQELLAPYPGLVREEIMTGHYTLPKSDGSGRDRNNLRKALELLTQAGWETADGRLVNAGTGDPFAFEILVATREQERIALAFANALRPLGIAATVRQVDSTQFQARLDSYDYDMVQYTWANSLSPGNEQAFYWGSEAADHSGTRNYMGVREPAIDALIEEIVAAHERDDLVAAVRALDRVLMSGVYIVPLYHSPVQWVARWQHISRPDSLPLYGVQFDSWWHANGE